MSGGAFGELNFFFAELIQGHPKDPRVVSSPSAPPDQAQVLFHWRDMHAIYPHTHMMMSGAMYASAPTSQGRSVLLLRSF
jgi:hypothetical protein